MRDPNRLNDVYEELCKIHKKYCPDWRFGQFIYNVLSQIGDPFYIEDDKIIAVVENVFKKEKSQDKEGY